MMPEITGQTADGGFAPTRWTRVLRASGGSSEARTALGELCEAYWTPVFRFIRGVGRNEDEARELTQEFFARLLARGGLGNVDPARGRFRSFLLGAVKHFLADMRDRERRLKRGGGVPPESLDGDSCGEAFQVADPGGCAGDAFFDRQWALTVMEHGLRDLQTEFGRAGRTDQFEVLKPWLVGETPALSQAEAARRLGMTEGAVKVAVHRLRKRFRELIRSQIAQTIAEGADPDEELNYLIEALTKC